MAVSKRSQKKRHLIIPGTTVVSFRGFAEIDDKYQAVAYYQMIKQEDFVIVGRKKHDDYHLFELGTYENLDFENPVWRKMVLRVCVDTNTGDSRVDVVFLEEGLAEINNFQLHGMVGRRAKLEYKVNYHPPKGWRKRK